ncbi:hypothetical protein HQ590_14040 [bacterium]|nr:hypothetical protein [bacterium]
MEARKSKAAAEIAKLDQAIAALSRLGGRAKRVVRRKRRKMSASARRRIAAAQRARWAKYRAGKGK